MKVTQNPIPNLGIEKSKATDKAIPSRPPEDASKASKTPAGRGSDAVEISDQAHMMKEARDIVHNTGDIRSDKVSDLKRRIKDGTYKVDSAAVADKLVEEHLASHFGKNDL